MVSSWHLQPLNNLHHPSNGVCLHRLTLQHMAVSGIIFFLATSKYNQFHV
jgi:hypothetical protein